MLKQIGKYTISERIGRGTYSRVYRAVDSQGRPVAIKVSTTRTEPDHLIAFQKDLVAAASVLHPSLAAVHDLGFEDDFPYLVMELVEGQDLAKLIKGNAAPSTAERIRAMQQVGSALKSAHERGVFHLDVRPSKIMVNEDGNAKLLDLGLGRLSFDPARLTEHGYLVGAPFYMSPERLTAIDTADERCDIWSFGVTFYEWLSGRHPFYDDDGDVMIGNIMDATPAPLDGVPAPLAEIVFRSLEKDAADRYQTFSDLLADLEPTVHDLKREESDALMAEALKQTDSGRWHEARRIARKMRDLEPEKSSGSQLFGISEPEPNVSPRENPLERTRPASMPSVAASVQPLVTAAATATAVDTPEPAPAPVQRPVRSMSAEAAPAIPPPPPRPQRPERTAPRIPTISPRNGNAAPSENGAPATSRVRPPSNPGNGNNGGVRAAAAAAAAATPAPAPPSRPAVIRELDTPPPSPRVEWPRQRTAQSTETTRPPAELNASQRGAPQPPPTVHILEDPGSSGFPWPKIISFAVAAALLIGALFFFLRPASKSSKPPAAASATDTASDENPDSRVIKGDPAATPTPASSVLTTTAGSTVIPPGDAPPQAPKAFDPTSLAPPKLQVPSKRPHSPVPAGMAPPSLAGGDSTESAEALPVAVNAPPPPVTPPPSAPPAAKSPVLTPAPAPAVVESAQPAQQSSLVHSGGKFTEAELVHRVQPLYPPAAMQRKVQGVVRFQGTIAKDGSVKDVRLLSGDPLLNVAAKQAVLQWKFKPAMLNGEAVEVQQVLVVGFKLNQ